MVAPAISRQAFLINSSFHSPRIVIIDAKKTAAIRFAIPADKSGEICASDKIVITGKSPQITFAESSRE